MSPILIGIVMCSIRMYKLNSLNPVCPCLPRLFGLSTYLFWNHNKYRTRITLILQFNHQFNPSTHYVQSTQLHPNTQHDNGSCRRCFAGDKASRNWMAAFIVRISLHKGVAANWQSVCNPCHVLPDKMMYDTKKWLAEGVGSKSRTKILEVFLVC